jgi:hypothetical protein
LNNQQLYLSVGIPSLLVALSWLTTFIQNNRLDTKIDNLRTEMANELRAVRGDINTITKMYGEHGERLAKLEAHK